MFEAREECHSIEARPRPASIAERGEGGDGCGGGDGVRKDRPLAKLFAEVFAETKGYAGEGVV